MRRSSTVEPIKNTIEGLIKKLDLARNQPGKHNFDFLLKKHLTKVELKHIKFNYFKKGVLGISVDSSSWLYQLSLKKATLLEELQKSSGNEIRDLRLRLGDRQ